MEMDWLKAYLDKETDVDIEKGLATFTGELANGADSGAEAFLEHLRDTEVISAVEFLGAHSSQAVETTVPGKLTWFEGADGPEVTEQAPSSFETTEITGTTGSRYRKIGKVGQGGMASIHLAQDENLRRKVAYKVMAPRVAANMGLVRRFLIEAQITAQLEHPNIVPVYSIESEPETGYLAYSMKLIDGKTLQQLLEASAALRSTGAHPPDDLGLPALLEHFLKVCDAVDYAHEKGVAHRDIKPANIMIGPHREVYVMDWGLAKVSGSSDQDSVDLASLPQDAMGTRVGAIMGTPAYMAPEQARGETGLVGPLSDQFALGLILYEMVCGRVARPRLDGSSVLLLAREGGVPDLQAPHPRERVSRELGAIITRATRADAMKRYVSVRALADDIRRYLANDEVMALPDNSVRRAQRWLSRHQETTFRTIMVLVILVGVVVTGSLFKSAYDAHKHQARQERLAAFVTDMGGTAAALNAHFSAIESQLEAVSSSSSMLLQRGETTEEAIWSGDFGREGGPTDFAMAPAYKTEISRHFPDVTRAGGGPLGDLQETANRLYPVRHAMHRAHTALRRRHGAPNVIGAEALWAAEKGPADWVMIGTSDGVLLSLPGIHWKAEGFDHRVRPWYTLGEREIDPTWGNPMAEVTSGTLMVPCSMSIRSDEGQALGVATITMGFEFLDKQFLKMSGEASVREAFLVDEEGRVMARSSERVELDLGEERLDEVHQMPEYHISSLVPDIRASRAGTRELEHEGEHLLLAWYRLSVANWSLVVEADADSLLGDL